MIYKSVFYTKKVSEEKLKNKHLPDKGLFSTIKLKN